MDEVSDDMILSFQVASDAVDGADAFSSGRFGPVLFLFFLDGEVLSIAIPAVTAAPATLGKPLEDVLVLDSKMLEDVDSL
jgi:hypothetical protein